MTSDALPATLRVVVVDDEQLARDELCYQLEQLGDIDVIGQSSDGLDALTTVARLNPDLVFLDVQMPGLGGFEVDLTSDSLAQRKSLVAADDAWEPDYVDVREDRVVLYGDVGEGAQRFVYRIKPTNRGHFQIPPVLIEGLYDRAAWGRGLGSAIDVTD